MIKLPVFSLKGEKLREINLSPEIFDVKPNDALLHQVYVSQYANRRQVIAHTKDRAERAGSGIKPWRQKGTGRARVGSVRSPIWRKGGVIFGPTKDRNFKKSIPRKMNRKAFLIALGGKAKDGEIIVVDNLAIEDLKTKSMRKAIDNLKIKGKALFCFEKNEKKTERAVRNIKGVKSIDAASLNVFEILNHKWLVLSEEGIKSIEKKHSVAKALRINKIEANISK